jgi:hypothetical protein
LTYANFDGLIGTADDIVYPPTVTTSGGIYGFSGLYPGVYSAEVVANVPANLTPTTNTIFTINLSEGEVFTTADFGFNEPPASIGGTVWNDKNGNTLLDASEPRESGVEVELYYATSGTTTGLTQTTAADGSYFFGNLSAGDYYVVLNTATIPSGFVVTLNGGDNDFDRTTYRTADINLPAGGSEFRDAGIILPGIVGLTLSQNVPLITNQFTPVTYTYYVVNTGGAPLVSILLDDPDNSPVYVGGDSNNDGKLDNIETWIYQATRTWTWTTPTRSIMVTAIVDALDVINTPSADDASVILTVLGANMELDASVTEVSPGDTVTLYMSSRLKNSSYVPDGQDAQLVDMQIACNIINGGAMWVAGPGSPYWADNDYVSSTPGAELIALDVDEDVDDNDNGLGEADWLHEYTFVVPMDQTSDLVIMACDHSDLNYYDGNAWLLDDQAPPGMDTLVLTLVGNQAMQTDEDNLITILNSGPVNPNAPTATIAAATAFAYPNPFVDRFVIESADEFIGGTGKIFNMNGQVIEEFDVTSSRKEIKIASQEAGMFFVRLFKDDQIQNIFVSKM